MTLAALIESCGPPASTLETQPVHSGPERELLVAGFLARGTFEIITRRPDGLSVRANERHYYQSRQADYADRYVAAFQSLCAQGFVRHSRSSTFVLTRAGWNHARKATAEFLHADWLLIGGRPAALDQDTVQDP